MLHRGCTVDWDRTKLWQWVKTPVRFLAVCVPKFMKFWDNVGDPSYFPTPLPDCLCPVSCRRYSPLSVAVVKNRTNVKVFWPPIFYGGTTPTSQLQVVSATYRPPFGKVWLSSVCWSPSAKPGNEVECRAGENSLPIWSRLWTKVHVVLRWCRRPLVVCNALAHLYTMFRSKDIGRYICG